MTQNNLIKFEKTPILVLGFAGRIGSGISFVRNKIYHAIASYGYDAMVIDVSEFILERYYEEVLKLNKNILSHAETFSDRVLKLQERGNELRQLFNSSFIADIIISDMIGNDIGLIDGDIQENNLIEKGIRKVYLIDSLKHPAEIESFRNTFGDAFYSIGVVSSDVRRKERLQQRKDYDEKTFIDISEIDANEKDIKTGKKLHYGQKTIDTVVNSDYFFINDHLTKDSLPIEAERFLKLIFKVGVETPRRDEYGMNTAFKSATRSACLSRQVGAAILSEKGEILSAGHNDVPQFGGGLYSSESDKGDNRCWSKGAKCYSDNEKKDIIKELVASISEDLDGNDKKLTNEKDLENLLEKNISSSRVKDLIEFSRAVHAEMEAILSVARSGKKGLINSTLYCTTYPCHNCAKHIIGAGIKHVVYLEPYEKSLARQLHSDDISDPKDEHLENKVNFNLYAEVAPSRYDSFFRHGSRKDKSGKFIDRDKKRSNILPIGAQDKDVLIMKIKRVIQRFHELIEKHQQQTSV